MPMARRLSRLYTGDSRRATQGRAGLRRGASQATVIPLPSEPPTSALDRARTGRIRAHRGGMALRGGPTAPRRSLFLTRASGLSRGRASGLRSLGAGGTACRRAPRRRGSPACGASRLARQRFPRRGRPAFALQRAPGRRGASGGGPLSRAARGAARRCGAAFGSRRCARRRTRQLHARTSRFRQADGNGLLRRSRAVFALADVVDLFANELARLR